MKIEIEKFDPSNPNNERRKRFYMETRVCSACLEWCWKETEKRAISKSAEFIKDFLVDTQSVMGSAEIHKDQIKLMYLSSDLKELWHYGSDEIRYLRGILQMVTLFSPTDIDMNAVLSTYCKMFQFGNHLSGIGHHPKDGYRTAYFEPEYPVVFNPHCLFSFLQCTNFSEIQNKMTGKEIIEHCKQAWKSLFGEDTFGAIA